MTALVLALALFGQAAGHSSRDERVQLMTKTLAPVPPPLADRFQTWQLADRSGQIWMSTDPVWLQRWVAGRNANPPVAAQVAVNFSPGPTCEAEIVARLSAARSSIRMLAYSFTSATVAEALIAARARGIDVAVVIDKDQAAGRGSQLAALRLAGIPVVRDGRHPIAHNKVVVIDGRLVLTGSYNFSQQARSNAENLLTLDSPSLAATYLADWSSHAAHAIP